MIDIHTHKDGIIPGIISVENKFPGDGFAAFFSSNYYSVGLHPWHIKTEDENEQMLQKVRNALMFEHVIAVGECGLDRLTEANFELQKQVFTAQVQLSEEFKKPLIIHCIKAYNELLQLRKSTNAKMPWIFHSYNGNLQITNLYIKEYILFSFGNLLFHERAKALDSFKILPLDKIFLETDEMSWSIEKVYKKAAQIRGVNLNELIEAIQNNFKRIFFPA